MTFTVITGKEKYKVVDLDTGGEAFFDEKLDAYKHMAIVANVLRHNYRLEVRD
jgi:hypothetical protein